MGKLKCSRVNYNSPDQVANLCRQVRNLLKVPSNYHRLAHMDGWGFSTPKSELPKSPGWYIILDGRSPIYVGRAKNLNSRLNTNSGSIDSFANQARGSDNERNFIKKFKQIGVIRNLRVCVIRENALFPRIRLGELDRRNTEKALDILRATFHYDPAS